MVFCVSDSASINGDGAAQPVPAAAEQQEPSGSDQTTDSDGASWPAPFEMPASVSEDPSASSQVSESLDGDTVNSFQRAKPAILPLKIDEQEQRSVLPIYV